MTHLSHQPREDAPPPRPRQRPEMRTGPRTSLALLWSQRGSSGLLWVRPAVFPEATLSPKVPTGSLGLWLDRRAEGEGKKTESKGCWSYDSLDVTSGKGKIVETGNRSAEISVTWGRRWLSGCLYLSECVELSTWKGCVNHASIHLTSEQSGEARLGLVGVLGMTGVLPGRQGAPPDWCRNNPEVRKLVLIKGSLKINY